MATDPLAAVDALIADRHLLRHPFYTAWREGALTRAALRTYAAQYYHHVRAFPDFIGLLYDRCDDPAIRSALAENLRDEQDGPENHPALWLRFARAVGCAEGEAASARPEPETTEAIAAFRRAVAEGPVTRGLAALYAYEVMVPAVAAEKIRGLAEHYGIEGPPGTDYFEVHRTMDVRHAAETRAHLAAQLEMDGDRAEAMAGAGAALAAVNGLLDGVCRVHRIARAA
ncbi:MAG TPA: CADD family putative folate metabolism protein [Gemmatimonadota bacterium]|nr:CADD family putative folate metabolism protein [Gemmatimonadota bacterium]